MIRMKEWLEKIRTTPAVHRYRKESVAFFSLMLAYHFIIQYIWIFRPSYGSLTPPTRTEAALQNPFSSFTFPLFQFLRKSLFAYKRRIAH
jgi:hypothetical protein